MRLRRGLCSTSLWRPCLVGEPLHSLVPSIEETLLPEVTPIPAVFIGLVESGIRVCAPVHDAVLIEAPIDQVDAVAAQARAILEKAGRVVLNGFTIRTDAKIVRYPERYSDPRGDVMWAKLMGLIETRNVANTHTECGELPLALWVPPTSVLSYL